MILSIRCRAIFIFKNMNLYQQNHSQDGKMLIRCAPWIQRSPVGTAELLLARLPGSRCAVATRRMVYPTLQVQEV